MTFEAFKNIAAAHRPDAIVHAHKSFGGVKDVAIVFRREDGSNSRVYSYRGSYGDILARLGIKVISKDDVATAQMMLRMSKEGHGKPSLFGKGIRDNSADIARYTALLKAYSSDEYVRDWEW